ncbi:MAG: hypothetical protein FWC42_09825 [Proteobacteria bacterium]|nr:hypothetical protein [Pseudomonadota bacterium]
MNIYTSCESVTAGDDIDAPHSHTFSFSEKVSLKEALAEIKRCYLPAIAGGCATWTVTSNRPVAVIAQQWAEPEILIHLPEELNALDVRNGVLRLHFNYHGQLDPQMVVKIFRGFRLHAT